MLRNIALRARQISQCCTANAGASALLVFRSQAYSTATAEAETGKYSYAKGTTVELPSQTVGHLFSQKVKALPFVNALRSSHQKISWSYQDLKRHSEAFACGLMEIGVRPGDTVAILQGTNAEQLVTGLACAKIGAAVAEIRAVKNKNDLERYLHLFRPRVLILPNKIGKVSIYDLVFDLLPELQKVSANVPLRSKRFPFCKQIIFTDYETEMKEGLHRLRDLLVYGPFGYYETPLRRVAMNITPSSPLYIFLDGADVNKANSIVFSQQNIIASGAVLGNALGLKPGDRVMVPQYLDSVFGAYANFACLTHGATIVYPSEAWNADETTRLLGSEKCTSIFATAKDFEKILGSKELSKQDLSALQSVVVIDVASVDQLNNIKNGLKVQNVISLAGPLESTGIFQINGQPAPSVEYKVTREDNKIVHSGYEGILKLRGPTVPVSLWNDIGVLHRNVDEDGFLNTGIKAVLDKSGNLVVSSK